MNSTTEKLQHSLHQTLDTLQVQLDILTKSIDSSEKLLLSEVIKNLADTQCSLADTLNSIIDGELDLDDDLFEDDFYDDNDKELNGLLDTKQISFEKSKKEKAKKNRKGTEKPEDEDRPF